MSSVATFQPYVDKENVGANPKNADRSRVGLGGKVFQSSSHGLSTPRSVLKDVNQGLSSKPRQDIGQKPSKPPVDNVFKKPAALSNHPSSSHKKEFKLHSDPVKKQKQVVTVQPDTKPAKKAEPLPPKENMHIYSDAEEVRPKMEIDFSGVVDMFRSWRPTCWFGSRDESDSDREFEPEELDMPEMEPEPKFTAEDLFQAIPYMDEDIDLPIPFVDDSLDIEPNMGTLEIWGDLSLPNSPQKSPSKSPESSLPNSPEKSHNVST